MPISPRYSAIREAQKLLLDYFGPTPLIKTKSLGTEHTPVYLKNETVLPTGSFKPRGALFALTCNLKRRRIEEVIASSTGNHGAAVAFAAKSLGVRATIFLPQNCNAVKRKNIEWLGARIVETGSPDLVGAFQMAQEYAQRPGVYFLNDATDPDLPAGPATIAMELLEQLPAMSTVIVPMGDTALIRGIGAALKQRAPGVKVVGVQAERAPSYFLSWQQGKAVATASCDTCADGLATRTPDEGNVASIREVVDEVLLVKEEQMLDAIRRLRLDEGVLAEPAGAASVAAYLNSGPRAGQTVLLVTGRNISEAVRQQAGIAAS
jgi:threonine dehydratase